MVVLKKGLRPRLLFALATTVLSSGVGGVAMAQDVASEDEIIVTAQRREQSLNDVPISITAFGADDIENLGVDNFEDLVGVTPGVQISTFGSVGNSSVFIRGVGSNLTDQGVEQGVGLYVDDVFIGSHQAFNAGLTDVARVEVLRGPQGTLYGKNTMGGAIRIISATPAPEFGVAGAVTLGEFGTMNADGMLNVPLSEAVAVRLSVSAIQTDPMIENTAGPDMQNVDQVSARLQGLFDLSPNTSLLLSTDWARDDNTAFARGDYDGVLSRVVGIDEPTEEERELQGYSATLTHDAGGIDITSITAYREMTYEIAGDGDFTAAPLGLTGQSTDFEQFSQEFRVNGSYGANNSWVAGLYYYSDESVGSNFFTLTGIAPTFLLPVGYTETSVGTIESQAWAAFFDTTFSLSSMVDLTLGLRYTDESKDLVYTHTATVPTGGVFAPTTPAPIERSVDMQEWTPRAVLQVNWSEDLMSYASVSRGVKSGGFNAVFVTSPNFTFDREAGWNYELGFKGDYLDGRLNLQAAAYYFDWEDTQAEVAPTPASREKRNVEGTSYGAEFLAQLHLNEYLSLDLGYAYTDAHYGDFIFSASPLVDFTDNRVPLVSENNFNAALNLRAPVSESLSVVGTVSYNYKSDFFFDAENLFEQEGYDVINARLGVEGPHWNLTLIGENLGDEAYRTTGGPNSLGLEQASVNNPRRVMVQLGMRY